MPGVARCCCCCRLKGRTEKRKVEWDVGMRVQGGDESAACGTRDDKIDKETLMGGWQARG